MEELDTLQIISDWKKQGKKIVFTNGCFDLVHAGHIAYLSEAKSIGDKLVVGLNSDESITNIKGANRPIQDIRSRFDVLSAIQYVDAVIVFHEDNPLKLIEKIKPDYLVKGADWNIEDIVGGDFVINNGGEVRNIPILSGYSSSLIIQKIKANEN